MKMLYGQRFLAIALVSLGCELFCMSGTVYAADLTPLNATVEPEFVIDVAAKTKAMQLDITLPTQGRDNSWNYLDLETIDKVEVYRAVNYSPVLIETFGPQTPGNTITFTESDGLVLGEEYPYQVWTYVGEKYSTTYVYGALFGLKVLGPGEDDLVLTVADDDKSVNIKVTCPEELMRKGSYGSEPLPEGVHFTALTVYAKDDSGNTVIVKNFEDPVPGTAYECDDFAIKTGNNTYFCKVETDFGVSEEISKTIFVGKDFPGKVGSLSASLQNEGVLVSWTAPEAYNGGRFDVNEVLYTVSRRENSGEWKVIADKIPELQYFDDLKDVLAECNVYYKVVPDNGVDPDGVNNAVETTNELVAGPAAPLPFKETFNRYANWRKNFDNRITENFNYNSFATPRIGYEESVTLPDNSKLEVYCGVDGAEPDAQGEPDNFYIVKPSMWGSGLDKGYITSGNLSFDEVTDPVLSFYYIPIETSTGQVTVEMLDTEGDETEFAAVQTVSYDPVASDAGQDEAREHATDDGTSLWKRVNVSLKDYAEKKKVKFRIAFQYASADNRHPMYFDHIVIGNYPPVSNLQSVQDGDDILLTWIEPAGVSTEDVRYDIYLNNDFGSPIATTYDTEYIFRNFRERGLVSFHVKAMYGDGGEAVEIPATSLNVESGISSVYAGDEVTVRYYDLDGKAATGSDTKTVLIKESVLRDGTIRRSKVAK